MYKTCPRCGDELKDRECRVCGYDDVQRTSQKAISNA